MIHNWSFVLSAFLIHFVKALKRLSSSALSRLSFPHGPRALGTFRLVRRSGGGRAQLGVAVALERWRISEDGFEGSCSSSLRSSLYDDRMDESRCAPPEKRNRTKVEAYAEAPGVRRAGRLPFRFPDGPPRGAELA